MGIGVKVKVWGEYALFSRPEMKVERCSYDVITPSAARGILEAIYWHPGMKWVIDKIYVQKPVQFTSIRRNEVKSKISSNNVLPVYNGADKPLYISTKSDIVQRASLLLRDVSYVIEAHFEMTEKAVESDNPGKFKDIIIRHILDAENFRRIFVYVKMIKLKRHIPEKKILALCFTIWIFQIWIIFSQCFSERL